MEVIEFSLYLFPASASAPATPPSDSAPPPATPTPVNSPPPASPPSATPPPASPPTANPVPASPSPATPLPVSSLPPVLQYGVVICAHPPHNKPPNLKPLTSRIVYLTSVTCTPPSLLCMVG